MTNISSLNIQSTNLSYKYPSGNMIHFPDLSLGEKEHLLIHGASGSGKTTWMHLIGGLLSVQNGNLIIQENDLGAMTMKELDAFRKKHIGLVFQKPHFVSSLSVIENLKLIQSYGDTSKDILSIAEELNLSHRLQAKPQDLSGGELQRMSIAMVMLKRPSLILADEPTASLDDENCDKVAQLLLNMAASLDANLIVVSHDYRLKKLFDNQISLSV